MNSSSVDKYIADTPDNAREVLVKIRKIIHEEIAGVEEDISYKMPVFKSNGKYIIYMAGWKNHVSLYPVPSGDEGFKKEIEPFVAGKGTLKFPLDKEMPYELIRKGVKVALREHLKKGLYSKK